MVRATVEDATDGTVLQTVAPVHAPAAEAVRALDLLREHVMAAIAGADFPWGTLYVYDPAANTWTRKSDIPAVTNEAGDRYYGAGNGVTAVIKGKLYVVSGCFMAWPPWATTRTAIPCFSGTIR
jgi:hypothetical protein